MHVLAYCAAQFARSTERAAGVTPVASPPASADNPPDLTGADLLYVALHGQEWEADWQGDDGLPAITAEQLAAQNLAGSGAFVQSCWLPESPMLDALFEAGALWAVGAPGENLASPDRLAGASLLGWAFRVFLQKGVPPALALGLAKTVAMSAPGAPRADLAGFRLYRRGTS